MPLLLFSRQMSSFITGRNEVVAKVIFLHLSVILFTGGCLPQCMLGYHSPGADTPLGADTPQSRHPQEQTPPRADTTPWEQTPPPRSRLPHTVNERPVRILLECILECILVIYLFRLMRFSIYLIGLQMVGG